MPGLSLFHQYNKIVMARAKPEAIFTNENNGLLRPSREGLAMTKFF
jgi:hypothetical protein